MSERRSPEEVHADGGHEGRVVQSCEMCQHDEQDAEQDDVATGEEIRTTEAAPEAVRTTAAGCRVCGRPVHHRGLCGSHWQSRRGMADPREASR